MERKLVVEAKGLVKRFADHLVVNGVHLQVYQGECFGVLGPNEAGKSTLMRMMYGSSLIEGGELFISGLNIRKNLREIKARIGILPQDDHFDGDFSVRENLRVYGSFFGIDRGVLAGRIEELLKLVRIEDVADHQVKLLSKTMRRRLGMARALINSPEVLFLDEPSAGLDAQGRFWMWDFIAKVKAERGTVLLTTHYMEEAEQVCDRIAILDRGEILAIGQPKFLIRENIGVQVVEFQVPRTDMQYYLSRLSSKKFQYQVDRNSVNVHLQNQDEVQSVLNLIQGIKVTIRQPTLSDVFLKLAGHQLREEPL